VIETGTASFLVVASGTPPLSYQWAKDGTRFPGRQRHADHFQRGNHRRGQLRGDGRQQWGRHQQPAAVLTVLVPPTITAGPHTLTVNQGATVTYTVTPRARHRSVINGPKTAWIFPARPTNVFIIPQAQTNDAGSYVVTVTNLAGSATSKAVKLTVNVPPRSSPSRKT